MSKKINIRLQPNFKLGKFWILLLIPVICSQFLGGILSAQQTSTRKLDVLDDVRLKPLKDLNGYFPFRVSKSKEEWDRRAADLRTQLRVALGIYPMPTAPALNPVIHGKIDRGDYTVERVYFESLPGFYVTGSLYRPKNVSGKSPGVLSPHGHWANGRFYDVGKSGIEKEISSGAEKFREGGRSPLQARAVHLARMGCVVFHYDMIGYADSVQISYELAHRFAKQRPAMNSESNWGLFSPQAESHLQSVMGLQTINSIRAIDFLEQLPDVDPNRIGVTGASGGGTQTMILAALDPRPIVSFPAVMVSTSMQGGCTCENCSLLRINTGNVEFAALYAPKPQAMSAANDWTVEMRTKGFPQLFQHYEMLGAKGKVSLCDHTEFPHNFNQVSRKAMYDLFAKEFSLDPVEERDYKRLTTEEMTVWNAEHPKPKSTDQFEIALLKNWNSDAKKQLETKNAEYFRSAFKSIFQRDLPNDDQIEWTQETENQSGKYLIKTGTLKNVSHGEVLPVSFIYPENWNQRTLIWTSEVGKSHLIKEGLPNQNVRKLLDKGYAVIGVDLFQQGDFRVGKDRVKRTSRVKNPREAAAYTFGYNHTLFSKRVHDVLTVVNFVANHDDKPAEITLVSTDTTSPILVAATTLMSEEVGKIAVNTNGFRFGKINDIHNVNFLPGGAKYGDLPGMIGAAKTSQVFLSGESKMPEIVKRLRGGDASDVSVAQSLNIDKMLNWITDQKK